MGVRIELTLVEHTLYVERGPAALEALAAGDPEHLRRLLLAQLALPWEVPQPEVEARRLRVAKLEELNAPEVILRLERQRLAEAIGAEPAPDAVRDADGAQLATLLHRWGRHTVFGLDKSWDLVHWFADPARRSRRSPAPPPFPSRSLLERALYGAEPAPRGADGPLWRDAHEVPGGYNPPAAARAIAAHLDAIDTSAWESLSPTLAALPRADAPYCAHGDSEDLEGALDGFAVLRRAYATAAAKGLGVSCEGSA